MNSCQVKSATIPKFRIMWVQRAHETPCTRGRRQKQAPEWEDGCARLCALASSSLWSNKGLQPLRAMTIQNLKRREMRGAYKGLILHERYHRCG